MLEAKTFSPQAKRHSDMTADSLHLLPFWAPFFLPLFSRKRRRGGGGEWTRPMCLQPFYTRGQKREEEEEEEEEEEGFLPPVCQPPSFHTTSSSAASNDNGDRGGGNAVSATFPPFLRHDSGGGGPDARRQLCCCPLLSRRGMGKCWFACEVCTKYLRVRERTYCTVHTLSDVLNTVAAGNCTTFFERGVLRHKYCMLFPSDIAAFLNIFLSPPLHSSHLSRAIANVRTSTNPEKRPSSVFSLLKLSPRSLDLDAQIERKYCGWKRGRGFAAGQTDGERDSARIAFHLPGIEAHAHHCREENTPSSSYRRISNLGAILSAAMRACLSVSLTIAFVAWERKANE